MNVSEAFKSRSMKSMLGDHLLRNGLSRISYDQSRKTSSIKLLPAATSSSSQADGSLITNSKQHHLKGKLSLVGGIEKVYRRIFTVREGEKVVRASRCCLSTTAGPIAGRLFISTHKIAFCSDKPIAKIVIPLGKIERLNQTENSKKTSQKYVQVVTADNFEFWFMGFKSYKKTLKCLQQAVSQALLC
ncbi:GEM-like protein 4 [Bienertia sinuspersici]